MQFIEYRLNVICNIMVTSEVELIPSVNMLEWTELSLFMDALRSKVKIVSSVFNKKHVFKNI